MPYIKLSTTSEFTILRVAGVTFKRWNDKDRRFETAPSPTPGFKKTYTVETKEGTLDLGEGQIGSILEACFGRGGNGIDKGQAVADIRNARVQVKTNGKSGMDIRYFFNYLGRDEATPEFAPEPEYDGPNY